MLGPYSPPSDETVHKSLTKFELTTPFLLTLILSLFPVCPTFPSTTNPCPKNTKLIDFQTCGMAQGASVNVIARKPSSLKGQPTRDYIYAQLYAHVSSKCCLAWSLHMRNVEVC